MIKTIFILVMILTFEQANAANVLQISCSELYTSATKIDIWVSGNQIRMRYENFSSPPAKFMSGIFSPKVIQPGFYSYKVNSIFENLQIQSSLFDPNTRNGRVSFGPNFEKGYYCESK